MDNKMKFEDALAQITAQYPIDPQTQYRDWELVGKTLNGMNIDWDDCDDFETLVEIVLEHDLEPWPFFEQLTNMNWTPELLANFAAWISQNEPQYLPRQDDGLVEFIREQLSISKKLSENSVAEFLGYLGTNNVAAALEFIEEFVGNNTPKWDNHRLAKMLSFCEENWSAATEWSASDEVGTIIEQILSYSPDLGELEDLLDDEWTGIINYYRGE